MCWWSRVSYGTPYRFFQVKGCTTLLANVRLINRCVAMATLAVLIGNGAVGCHATLEARDAASRDAYLTRRDKSLRRAAALFEEGLRARTAGQSGRARALLGEAIKQDGTNGRARHALGLIDAEAGDLYHAAIHFDAASRLLTDAPEPCYNLGVVLERGGCYEQAISSYTRALRRQPDHLYTMGSLARARLRAGYRDGTTLQLLRQCRARESRSDWVEWLDRQVIRLSVQDTECVASSKVADGSMSTSKNTGCGRVGGGPVDVPAPHDRMECVSGP